MAGVLDYKRYLNTLQAITDWGNTFPSTQETYVFSVEGGVTSSWTATIQWQTLLVDAIKWDRNQQPVFNDSLVIGYFESSAGTSTQYSTGVISIPANMYTGPILPTSDRYVPVTVVNLSWTDGTETYEHQLGLIQNWEPGVTIDNPYDSDDFEPVYPLTSTLTLSVDTPAIYGDPFTIRAESDLPIEISPTNVCSFYATSSTGATFLLTTATFTGLIASKELTAVAPLTATNYTVYAEFGGQREYGRTQSNTATLEVVPGIPLIAVDELFTPSQSYYYPGNQFNYRLTVDAAPGFTATTTIANTVTVSIINQFPPTASATGFNGQFADGVATATFTVTNTMIDTGILHTGTNYTLLSYTSNTATFTASIFVSNTSTINSQWLSYRPGKYAAGSHNRSVNVATTISKTLSINSFPISIAQAYTATLYGETLPLPVVTVSTPYFNNVSIYAVSVAAPTTHVLLDASNNSGTSTYTVNTAALTTGTWTIYASYPGDIGSSIYYVNAASTSNNLTHVVKGGNVLNAVLKLRRTPANDILTVRATTSTTLTNTVSFLNGVSVLGTSTWSRQGYTETQYSVWYQGGAIEIAKAANNYSSLFAATTSNDWVFNLGAFGQGWPAENQTVTNYLTVTNATVSLPDKNPNAYRLWKYYDGTNYNLNAVTGTDITPLLEPITTSSVWIKQTGGNLPGPTGVIVGTDAQGRQGWIYPTTTIPLVSIWKQDEIGDYRGYNVIAINAESGITRPPVEHGPVRLDFTLSPLNSIGSDPTWWQTPLSKNSRHIDLVEYIGYVEWQKPSPDNSTVKAWLFKFTPEVRQSPDLLFKRMNPSSEIVSALGDASLPQPIRVPTTNPTNTTGYDWVQFPAINLRHGHSANPTAADFGVGSYDVQSYINYGQKTWPSLNPSDPTETDYAYFCQHWFWMNTSDPFAYYPSTNYRNPITATIATIYTATSVFISTGNIHTAEIYLPPGTITTTTGIHATWPGTLALSSYYGKFEPFDINVSSSSVFQSVLFDVYNQNSAGAKTTATVIYSTNKVLLESSVVSDPPGILATTGTITIIDDLTNNTLLTLPITTGSVSTYVYADDLTSLTTAPFLNLKSRYSNPGFEPIDSPIKRVQVVKSSYPYSATIITGGGEHGFNFASNGYPYGCSIPILSKTFLGGASWNIGTTVKWNGTVNLTLPYFQGTNPLVTNYYLVMLRIVSQDEVGEPTSTNWFYPSTPSRPYWQYPGNQVGTQPLNYSLSLVNASPWTNANAKSYTIYADIQVNHSSALGKKVFINHNVVDNKL